MGKIFIRDRRILNILVCGEMQTGKTGCMTALIQQYMLDNHIPIDHIYIITGLSDKQWKQDTKNRLPSYISERIFHRANLSKTFSSDIKDKKNCLIIMDEIQQAAQEDQTINKTFEQCDFYNLETLIKNDIKFVQFSATPDGHINDIEDWDKHSAKIKLTPGEGYFGVKQAIEQKRVKQFKDLTNQENVLELKNTIEKNNMNIPGYILIRVPNRRKNKDGSDNQSIVISNFKTIFGEEYEYNTEYLLEKKSDINDTLKKAPICSTIIFYCEILRCAKTQCKKYIHISYERYAKNISSSTIVQGSFGRLCGYDDNGKSICYTDIETLKEYIKLCNNDMEFAHGLKWVTKSTKYSLDDEMTYSNGTYNSVKYIDTLKENCSEKVKENRREPEIHIEYGEEGQVKMIKWFKDLKKSNPTAWKDKRGPNRKKPDENGFYKGSIRNGLEVLSKEKVDREKKFGFKRGNVAGVRSFPCYSDVTDKSTLEWWLIYYEPN